MHVSHHHMGWVGIGMITYRFFFFGKKIELAAVYLALVVGLPLIKLALRDCNLVE